MNTLAFQSIWICHDSFAAYEQLFLCDDELLFRRWNDLSHYSFSYMEMTKGMFTMQYSQNLTSMDDN